MPKSHVSLLLVALTAVSGCFLLPADAEFSVQGSVQGPKLTENECTLRILESESGNELAKRSIERDFFTGAVISPSVSLVDIEISCVDTDKIFRSKVNKAADYQDEPLDLGIIDLTNGE